mgnify:FL=1|jgi:hypothetical protein|tara:strand:- start:600 stop:983 length:384 start_codon:yes stop_codon:yes gene_type:complete
MKHVKVTENAVPVSFRNIASQTILFRLVNPKRSNSKAFQIFESVKNSTTIKEAFSKGYRPIDYEYDTTKNNRFKKAHLLSSTQLNPAKKAMYQDLLAHNAAYIKSNKVSDDIKKAQSYYTDIISKLK